MNFTLLQFIGVKGGKVSQLGKVRKDGEYSSPSIHRKRKPRTKTVRNIQQQPVEQLLEKHSIDYLFSKQELKEIEQSEDLNLDFEDYTNKRYEKIINALKNKINKKIGNNDG